MKTWVKFEIVNPVYLAKFITADKATMKDSPTVPKEIKGTIGERKTRISTIKMKTMAITSVFLRPSSMATEKSSFKISLPVT